ncbi:MULTISPECIES: hypothetical protein [unclassified Lysobacter]|uniref:hypothetical protein n=1 Tax=unclassified Lysobacter TaxID=2635362 RepID=UPI0020354267|nr:MULTISPECIES: hypothetical protein [unclassified Lysobacter]
MSKLAPPPVPSVLREILKDYPEHIERLQELLAEFLEPKLRLQPYDEAVWALEDAMSGFLGDANKELKAAEASGDAMAIEKAAAKAKVMSRARSGNIGLGGRSLQELWEYFQTNKEAFE